VGADDETLDELHPTPRICDPPVVRFMPCNATCGTGALQAVTEGVRRLGRPHRVDGSEGRLQQSGSEGGACLRGVCMLMRAQAFRVRLCHLVLSALCTLCAASISYLQLPLSLTCPVSAVVDAAGDCGHRQHRGRLQIPGPVCAGARPCSAAAASALAAAHASVGCAIDSAVCLHRAGEAKLECILSACGCLLDSA